MLSVCSTVNSDRHWIHIENSTAVHLYNSSSESSDKEGVVSLSYNEKCNFINGTGWDYNGARVVCRTRNRSICSDLSPCRIAVTSHLVG